MARRVERRDKAVELDCHPGEQGKDNSTHGDDKFRIKVTPEDIITQAPYHCRDKEQDKEPVPALPGAATDGDYQ